MKVYVAFGPSPNPIQGLLNIPTCLDPQLPLIFQLLLLNRGLLGKVAGEEWLTWGSRWLVLFEPTYFGRESLEHPRRVP